MRIGPKMAMAESIVRENPGCAILPVAERIGPHGSTHYGYRAVWRAIAAGLIRAEKMSNRYALYVDDDAQTD